MQAPRRQCSGGTPLRGAVLPQLLMPYRRITALNSRFVAQTHTFTHPMHPPLLPSPQTASCSPPHRQQVGAGPHAAPQAQHCVRMAPQQEHHSLTWQCNAARCGQTKHLQTYPAGGSSRTTTQAKCLLGHMRPAGLQGQPPISGQDRLSRECINVMMLRKWAVVSKLVETHTLRSKHAQRYDTTKPSGHD